VVAEAAVVGRIFKANAAPVGAPYRGAPVPSGYPLWGVRFDPEDVQKLAAALELGLSKLELTDRQDPPGGSTCEVHHRACDEWRARPSEAVRQGSRNFRQMTRLSWRLVCSARNVRPRPLRRNSNKFGSSFPLTWRVIEEILCGSGVVRAERPMKCSHLANLNSEQQCAAEYGQPNYTDAGPLLIIAGAGTGKTNTLAHRVANLIVNGIDPRRILLLTFSRRAATEMIRRVERITAYALRDNAGIMTGALTWSGTFHAIGARLLREYAHQIGLSPSFTIHDREDSADLLNLVRHDLGFSKTDKRFPAKSTCLSIYSRVVNTEGLLEDVLESFFPWCETWEAELRQLFSAYVEAKQRQDVLDYDDLLLYWAQMMQEQTIAADLGERFDHVLVDEYQDTNRLQASILLALKPSGKGLTVVGDDAQSIYSFRAATVRNILNFPGQFSPRAEIATLERNYRSTQPILSAANAVMDLAEEHFTKNLWSERASAERPRLVSVRDEADQARYVAETILENRERGIVLKTQAVLFRASHHSAPLEIELNRLNIPFVKFGGLKFLEAAHIKDVLAFLRWAENPRDRVAGFRVLQLLPAVGPATAARVLDRIAEAADALQAIQIASTYPTRERFLTELTLDPPDATSDEAGVPLLDEDYLILSTIHSAKGQEWRSVFILNAMDGCIPSDLSTGSAAEVEEERRLLYVAMTRAKDHLDLLLPQRFFAHQQKSGGDRHVYTARTRFIPDAIVERFDVCAWPKVRQDAMTRSGTAAATPIDIRARMRRMWR
jgi:DNA helicase II / ATP-dependent DNA helicase PcrA